MINAQSNVPSFHQPGESIRTSIQRFSRWRVYNDIHVCKQGFLCAVQSHFLRSCLLLNLTMLLYKSPNFIIPTASPCKLCLLNEDVFLIGIKCFKEIAHLGRRNVLMWACLNECNDYVASKPIKKNEERRK